MLRTHALRTRLRLVGPLALICALRAPQASAQTPAALAEPPPALPAAVPASTPDGAKPAEASPAPDTAALHAELDEVKRTLAEVKAQQSEAATAAASAADESASEPEPLKIYGFTDVGVQHLWSGAAGPLAKLFPLNTTSFVTGNINLYFDAQPIKHFRGLTELRFTNEPRGEIDNYGGLAGSFRRKATFFYDPTSTAPNAQVWAGSVILERAWLEWNEHQAFKFRIGNFFTPFGIWNEDHGTPTLIALALPQFILESWMPIRQTGVMIYGSAFAGDWELGYTGTFTNGREEISSYNFDNNFGLGARVYARRDMGRVNTTLGLSYFTGKTLDTATDIVASSTGTNGLAFVQKTITAYTEHVAGADVSVDVDATRIRAEAVVRRLVFHPGERTPGNALFEPGSFMPDSWQESAYVLVAHQLPWLGIEPYLWGEAIEEPTIFGDLLLTGSVGVNVHFNPSIQWKNQLSRGALTSWLSSSPYDSKLNNTTSAYSRLVMAF